jgi:N-acetylglucosamine kinase-like BadF-type ATPase
VDHVLAVDGGNTKTVALVARIDGTIVGSGRAGCGDIYGASSEQAAIANIRAAVAGAVEGSRLGTGDIAFAAYCLAGADWPEDHVFLERELRGSSRRLRVLNDGFGALRAGSDAGEGVAIVCGTYAAVVGRATGGASWSGSFWQEPCGALAVAQQVLHATYRADLGIDPPTGLTSRVLEYFGLESVGLVVHHLTSRGDRARRRSIAGLARVLLDEADAGDAAALHIVANHGRLLAEYGSAAARQVGLAGRDHTVVLAGGMFRHPTPALRAAVARHLAQHDPGAQCTLSAREPVYGGLLLALEEVRPDLPAWVVQELDATMPPASFFAT